MRLSDLYFERFRTIKPGDTIVVWRNDVPMGHIRAEHDGSFSWRLSYAQPIQGEQSISTYEQAQGAFWEAWAGYMDALGMTAWGESEVPSILRRPIGEAILIMVGLCTTSDKLLTYMKTDHVQRHLADMEDDERRRVRGIAAERFKSLQSQEARGVAA